MRDGIVRNYKYYVIIFVFVILSLLNADAFASSIVFSLSHAESTALEWQYKNIDYWLSFLTTLSALLAGFFIYSGFKINDTVDKVESAKRDIQNSKDEIQDLVEYGRQLEYSMSYIISQQFEKAIDSLESLRKELFVRKDENKQNTCFFFLAHCYYEKFKTSTKEEDISFAVYYINLAIEDEENPLKQEIITAFIPFNPE